MDILVDFSSKILSEALILWYETQFKCLVTAACPSWFLFWQPTSTFHSSTRPRYVFGTSSLHFWILQEVLQRFKKKIMEKDWKFLIKNRFWNRDRKIFENFRKIKIFKIFEKSKIRKFSNPNPIIKIFEKSIFSKKSKILIFRKFRKISGKISISISKSIFDQKISIVFHDFF